MTDRTDGIGLRELIREYARDLRRNSSGGDGDYPWEWAKATADYLEILLKRAAPPKPAPDREALIHTICPHIRQYSDSHWQGNHACLQCPATVKTPQGDAVQRCRRDAERAADDVIRCWQSTGDQQAPQVSGASTPAVVLQERSTPNKGD